MSTWTPGDEMLVVQRAPQPGAAGGTYRAFGETLRGLKTTMARLFEGPTTIAVTIALTVASGSSTFQPKLISWS